MHKLTRVWGLLYLLPALSLGQDDFGFGAPTVVNEQHSSAAAAQNNRSPSSSSVPVDSRGFTPNQAAAVQARDQAILQTRRQYDSQLAGLQQSLAQAQLQKGQCDTQNAEAQIANERNLQDALNQADQNFYQSLGPTIGSALGGLAGLLTKQKGKQNQQRDIVLREQQDEASDLKNTCRSVPGVNESISISRDGRNSRTILRNLSDIETAAETTGNTACKNAAKNLIRTTADARDALQNLNDDDQANNSGLLSTLGGIASVAMAGIGSSKSKKAAKENKGAADDVAELNYDSCLANADATLDGIRDSIARLIAARNEDLTNIGRNFVLPPPEQDPNINNNPFDASDPLVAQNLQNPITVESNPNLDPAAINAQPAAELGDGPGLAGAGANSELASLGNNGANDGNSAAGGGGGGGSGGGGGGGAGGVAWTFQSPYARGRPGGGGLPESLKAANKSPGSGASELSDFGGGTGFEDPFANAFAQTGFGQGEALEGEWTEAGPLGDGGLKVMINKMQRLLAAHLGELLSSDRNMENQWAQKSNTPKTRLPASSSPSQNNQPQNKVIPKTGKI